MLYSTVQFNVTFASICILVVLKKNLYVCMACTFAMNAYGREQKINVLIIAISCEKIVQTVYLKSY